jgi:hypothetical protein
VLHRDIKPSNILLEHDGHTKITDFGIAKSFDIQMDPAALADDMTITGFVLGTPGYLAPERRLAYPATVQSDVYSVGAVMVETLTGQRLGSGAAPTERLPAAFRDVARRALATDPRDRFTSADEMLHALRNATAGTRAATPRPSPRPRPPWPDTRTVAVPNRAASGTALFTLPRPARQRGTHPRVRRRRLALAAIAVVALAVLLFVLFETGALPTGPATSVVPHHVARPQTQALTRPSTTPTTDAQSSAISALAASLANGGFPGDGALASALQATAAEPPGTNRESSAQETLSLAGVLLDGGGLTSGQYQDVVTVLQPTGATVTTTTSTTAPMQQFQVPFFQSPGHGHGRGDGAGGQG